MPHAGESAGADAATDGEVTPVWPLYAGQAAQVGRQSCPAERFLPGSRQLDRRASRVRGPSGGTPVPHTRQLVAPRGELPAGTAGTGLTGHLSPAGLTKEPARPQ